MDLPPVVDPPHILEREYESVLFVIALWLAPEESSGLSRVSSSIAKLFRDDLFWKHQFERAIQLVFPPNQHPGNTGWLEKYQTVQYGTMTGKRLNETLIDSLFCSVEVFDLQIAHLLFGDELVSGSSGRIIAQALQNAVAKDPETGNESVLRYLTTTPVFKMKEYLATTGSDSGSMDMANSSVKALMVLLDPALDLAIDVPTLIIDTIICRQNANAFFLLQRPEADLENNRDDYICVCEELDNEAVLNFLNNHT